VCVCGDGYSSFLFCKRYSNGDVFKGNFVAGVRSGTGEYRAGSIVYVGDFANDDAHGEGQRKKKKKKKKREITIVVEQEG
jgi:hypothetical protein